MPWLVKSAWGVAESKDAALPASQLGGLAFQCCFSLLRFRLSHHNSFQPMLFLFLLILTDECLQFNLSSGSREKHGLIAHYKHNQSPQKLFHNILQHPYCTAKKLLNNSDTITGRMNAGNTEPHCHFQSSNSWRGVTLAKLHLILHTKRSKKKSELLRCSEEIFGVTKVEKRKTQQTQRKVGLLFHLFLKERGDVEWKMQTGFQ